MNSGASGESPAPEGSPTIRTVIHALTEHKAIDVVVLDLRQLSDATDYFIIASGSSDTHVKMPDS